jgi:hypothetical protein
MKLLVLVSCLVGLAATGDNSVNPSSNVTFSPAPIFAPAADCDGEGICHNPNASCRAEDDEYCNSSLPAFPSGCKDPDMAGRDSKSDPNGDCCWCLYNT